MAYISNFWKCQYVELLDFPLFLNVLMLSYLTVYLTSYDIHCSHALISKWSLLKYFYRWFFHTLCNASTNQYWTLLFLLLVFSNNNKWHVKKHRRIRNNNKAIDKTTWTPTRYIDSLCTTWSIDTSTFSKRRGGRWNEGEPMCFDSQHKRGTGTLVMISTRCWTCCPDS